MRIVALIAEVRWSIVLLACALACGLIMAAPIEAHAVFDNDIPGVPMSPWFWGELDAGGDTDDVFRVYLQVGERIRIEMTEQGAGPSNFDIALYPASEKTILDNNWVALSGGFANPQMFEYEATVEGWYFLRVGAASGSGDYTVRQTRWFTVDPPPPTPDRVWGSDRYTTAVEIARENFPGWKHCEHVIIASGEERAAADPLSAAGLSWTYGAPIMLVQSDAVPNAVINALQAIADANYGIVTVHVVGGPVSVPEARLKDIEQRVSGFVIFDRVLDQGDRYDLAAAIAYRMNLERPNGHRDDSALDKLALIANGADSDKFFDALALSPIAANNGYPILLVEQDKVPAATQGILDDLKIDGRLVGGGPATVSDNVVKQLQAGGNTAGRWAGKDRYETASTIAGLASVPYPPMLWPYNVGVTAKLPDALAGGVFTGLRGGPVIITPTDRLDESPRGYLSGFQGSIDECFVLGGPVSVTESTRQEIRNAMVP